MRISRFQSYLWLKMRYLRTHFAALPVSIWWIRCHVYQVIVELDLQIMRYHRWGNSKDPSEKFAEDEDGKSRSRSGNHGGMVVFQKIATVWLHLL